MNQGKPGAVGSGFTYGAGVIGGGDGGGATRGRGVGRGLMTSRGRGRGARRIDSDAQATRVGQALQPRQAGVRLGSGLGMGTDVRRAERSGAMRGHGQGWERAPEVEKPKAKRIRRGNVSNDQTTGGALVPGESGGFVRVGRWESPATSHHGHGHGHGHGNAVDEGTRAGTGPG
ncbi:unnamed protein product, partial [Discosporangium mesarthrocarpum]